MFPWAAAALISIATMTDRPALADDDLAAFERREYRDAEGAVLPYRLLRPRDYDAAKRYPLVLFLHGAGERGTDNEKQLVHGMREFLREEMRADHACFVVAPQCPDKLQWVDTPWTAEKHTMPERPTVPLRQTLELLEKLPGEFAIDADRVYVTGLSMGGFGVWDALQRRPELFAAAAPICGGGDPAFAERIARIPLWAYHGDADTTVKVRRSRDMIAALKQAGGEPRYTEYAGVGHNSWTAAYRDEELYKWLFAQRRTK
jgi:predicted peptidase